MDRGRTVPCGRAERRTLVVQKFGGTSVAGIARVRAVAARVVQARARGARVVVVVSAMAGETDKLLALAADAARGSELPTAREIDAAAATGEQVSAALVALALRALGVPARSLSGAQAGVRAEGSFTAARVASLDPARVRAVLDGDEVPVVAGFQGVNDEGDVMTLGRGGSDTTAVALAAALGADTCEIFTDVGGVYTADPSVCRDARRIARLSYARMHALALLGAKVLHAPCVELAARGRVRLHVRSSFTSDEGTWIEGEDTDHGQTQVVAVTSARGPRATDAVVALVGAQLAHLGARAASMLGAAGVDVTVASAEHDRVRLVVLSAAAGLAVETLHRAFVLGDVTPARRSA